MNLREMLEIINGMVAEDTKLLDLEVRTVSEEMPLVARKISNVEISVFASGDTDTNVIVLTSE